MALRIRGLADLLTYAVAVAIARWIAIAWVWTLPQNLVTPQQLRFALVSYGVITTLFSLNVWQRSRAGQRDEMHPLVVPALIAIDLTYAALAMKLYGVTLLVLMPALDAAALAVPIGLAVVTGLTLLLVDLALNFHSGSASSVGLQIAGMTFGPYLAALFGQHGRQRAERQVRAIDQVLNAGSELGSQLSLADVLVQLLNLLCHFRRVVPWETCVIYVVQYDEIAEEEMLVAAEIAGADAAAYRGTKIAFGTGVVGYAAAKQRPALVADLLKDARQPDADLHPHARGSLVVPIVADAQAVGCVQLLSSQPNLYTRDQLEHVGRLISLASVGVRNALLHIRTRAMADTDSLTGLLSSRAYHERLESEFRKAQAARKSLSLLLIDLDNFKDVNDNFGHQAGDELLRRIGGLLRQQARRNDVYCRYGGDEFIVVMPETIKSEAAMVADRIRKAIGELAFTSGKSLVQATVSIGVASYPQDVTNKQALIKAADDALYAAKDDGRNSLRVFAPPVAR
ncbi:MAG: sensor domain-containing diguanylate cyclase [Candidatus Eremiobacteraeota bacterium]|nr:sensor domain-containing diguanylate cyclase [Candidatus Eremiobacteraeota bacterium]